MTSFRLCSNQPTSHLICIAAAVLLSLGFLLPVTAAPLIIPVLSDYPIGDGQTRESLNANVLNALQKNSQGQIKFQPLIMPQSRAWKYIEQNDACIFNQIKTPQREQIATYTNFPLTLYPPIRLIVKDNDNRWPSQFDPVNFNLPSILQVGVVSGHSFGTVLDAAITAHPESFFSRSGTESSFRLIDMLMAGRIDGVLNYTLAVNIYVKQTKNNFKFKSLPIKGLESGTEGFMVCSPSEAGKAMAARINTIYASPAMQADYLQIHHDMYGNTEDEWLVTELKRLKLADSTH